MIPIHRDKLAEVQTLVDDTSCIALLGPRQVGKTTLAFEIKNDQSALYLDLEAPRDRNKLTDPESYLRQHQDKLIIMDEIHRAPELFNILRGLIDENRRQGNIKCQFLILGSASIDLLNQASESLAGRITYVELYPFNLTEVGIAAMHTLWLRGGFPDSFLSRSERYSQTWRRNFIRTYLERDIPQFGPRIPAETLRRFWTMLAHLQGELLNYTNLGRSLGVTNKTISNYLDLLTDLLLVRRLLPWKDNTGKRLVKSPKIYIRDSGLMHSLLHISDYDSLMGHPKSGDSWEGFVIENLLSVAPTDTEATFYRTAVGAEIDLVLQFSDQTWAIEIKRSTVPKLTKGFYSACADIHPTAQYVVYNGEDSYPLREGIEALSLPTLMKKLRTYATNN